MKDIGDIVSEDQKDMSKQVSHSLVRDDCECVRPLCGTVILNHLWSHHMCPADVSDEVAVWQVSGDPEEDAAEDQRLP